MSDAWLVPEKAFLPVAISYSRAPKAKRSLRASASLPSSCSGAMYWNVPRTVPRSVSGWLACISVARRETPDETSRPAAWNFARPKSSSFTPDFVSMTLPGFRSRCTIPCRCALSSASAISIPKRRSCSAGSGPLAQAVRQRLALEVLHDEVLGLAFAVDVVERADVRMRDLRDRLRLALEALAQLRVRREVRRQDLDRDRALEARVPRLVDLAHPTGADRRQDLVGTELGSRRERHRLRPPSCGPQLSTTSTSRAPRSEPPLTKTNRFPSLETS